MITRRDFAIATTAGLTALSLPRLGHSLEVNEDGLHVQDWFLETFMDINEDQQEQQGEGKHLAVLFEQRGCPYCAEMHKVNFSKPKIVDFVKENFGVLQINIWGSRTVTDLDGEELEERDFARKWGVNFTPTTVFLRQGDVKDVPLKLAEASRMPGYMKPFHFISMYEFVAEKRYEDTIFQRFLQEKFERYQKEGKDPNVWDS